MICTSVIKIRCTNFQISPVIAQQNSVDALPRLDSHRLNILLRSLYIFVPTFSCTDERARHSNTGLFVGETNIKKEKIKIRKKLNCVSVIIIIFAIAINRRSRVLRG